MNKQLFAFMMVIILLFSNINFAYANTTTIEGLSEGSDEVVSASSIYADDVKLNALASDAVSNIDNPKETRYTVLVLDTSGSMRGVPLNYAKTSAIKFCTSLLNANGKNYIALVSYASNATLTCDFTDNLDTITTKINNVSADGGTNTNDALLISHNALGKVPENAIRNIVLLSDGLPESGEQTYTGHYSSSDYSDYSYANTVYNTAQELKKQYNIYSLGFFHSLTSSKLKFGQTFMSDLQDAGYYEVTNPEELEFTFGQISESITQSELLNLFIKEHQDYFDGGYKSDIKCVMNADSSHQLNEHLNEIMDEIYADDINYMYVVSDFATEIANLNLLSLKEEEIEILEKDANNFDLLIADISTSEYYKNTINDVANKVMMNDLSRAMETIIDLSDEEIKLIADANDMSVSAIKDEWFELASQLDEMNLTDDPKKYAELFGQCSIKVDQFIKGTAKNKIIEKLKGIDGVGGITFEALLGSSFETVSDMMEYYACYDAYITATDTYISILRDAAVTGMIYNQNFGDKYHATYFLDAVSRFVENVDKAKTTSANEIAIEFAQKGFENFAFSMADESIEEMIEAIPYVGIVYKIKEAAGHALSVGMLFVNTFTNIDDRVRVSALSADLAFMNDCFTKVSADYGSNIKKANNLEEQFKWASMFDESIRIYKAGSVMLCDFLMEYEKYKLEASFSPEFGGSWASTAISMVALEKSLIENIKCHALVDYDPNTKTFVLKGKGKIIAIACPVTMTIKDENGEVIATLSDSRTSIKTSYEPYFGIFKSNDGYGKMCYVPESWEVTFAGTGAGKMDVYTANVDENGNIANQKISENIQITEKTKGYFDNNNSIVVENQSKNDTQKNYGHGGGGRSSRKATTTTNASTEATTEATTESAIKNEVRVRIGDKAVQIGDKTYNIDVAPYIQASSQSTLVPLRFVALAICGGDLNQADNSNIIGWDAETKTATINANGKRICFTAGSSIMTLDGNVIDMDNNVQAEITNSRIFIPFRALGKALGVDVDWDADTKTAVYTVK